MKKNHVLLWKHAGILCFPNMMKFHDDLAWDYYLQLGQVLRRPSQSGNPCTSVAVNILKLLTFSPGFFKISLYETPSFKYWTSLSLPVLLYFLYLSFFFFLTPYKSPFCSNVNISLLGIYLKEVKTLI